MELITNSRALSFKRCRLRHRFEYEAGLRPVSDAKALRMGSAYHAGMEAYKQSGSADDAVAAVRDYYVANTPETAETDFEQETVACLVQGYAWRWQEAFLEPLAVEQAFQLPLRNPATSARSTVFDLAGKIDGIVRLEDGRLAVLEHKTVSEDVGQDSDYWRRLQLDSQITLYCYAARQLGYDVSAVLYDVARKPTIKPTPVAEVDDLGAKIVVDAAGERVKTERGLWRQTGDKAKGYTMLTRDMTADEWSQKLIDDIFQRPDYYYARREIVCLDQDIQLFLAEAWDLQKTLRIAQRESRWYRTVSRDTCPYCPYWALCSSGFDIASGVAPEGFSYVTDLHPELGEHDGASSTPACEKTAPTP